ncbi:MAG: hypothetical protein F6K50_07260 [Moorea sp. SIO3I7]|uniref:hypothetical protein n=1 Tax=Moorena sp. SIO3I8 TaxID=2607833 RepID=UPI0013C0281C|nr:hypothetical protein [Moorena sp. SIO3I8]NEN95334.1 hypothetical protein [Moorena sp. SIO3I7]NEO07396.1 hypothetical protein [Moorena sp. SIO3I8]
MIFVKNITQYSVSSTVSPTVPSDTTPDVILSHSKTFCEDYKTHKRLTREEWSLVLKINKKTLQRWEENIIMKVPTLAFIYCQNFNKKKKQGLDDYQRYILIIILALKKTQKLTNEQVRQFLANNWLKLTRENFNKQEKK